MEKVELLAPAGTYECFEAALKAGADAVYLGLNVFGARAMAGNFTEEELLMALDKAHILGKKIYLTLNTLLKDSELPLIYDCIHNLYLSGLDGVIVQDTGVAAVLRDSFPELPIHASTQMAITDTAGVEFAKKLGITRVVPARELSIEEISCIHKKTGMELECFIHGAMCYSYSGKCLFSSFLGGRSGNRGRCAQPCRLPYDDNYLLSMKDLCTIDNIAELIEAGIASFKIEGRMKSAQYVYGVTSLYRKYIDQYYDNRICKVSKEDRNALLSLYTRGGNCDGYYHRKNGRNMLTITSPSYASDKSDINLKEISLPKVPVNIMCNIYADTKISICVELCDDYDIEDACRRFDFEYDIVPELAQKNAATQESVRKQLIKCGSTDFMVRECIINIGEGLFVTNGLLNQIRRDSLDNVEKAILRLYNRKDNTKHFLFGIGDDIKNLSYKTDSSSPESYGGRDRMSVNVSVLNYDQLRIVVNSHTITGVIIPLGLVNPDNNDFVQLIEKTVSACKNIYIRLPYVIRDNPKCISENSVKKDILQFKELLKKLSGDLSGAYVSNYESIIILSELNFEDFDIVSDIHMYDFNRVSTEVLRKNSVTRTTVPVELCEKELVARGIHGEELIVYGRMPMMVSAQCLIMTKGKCKPVQSGNDCYIIDRKGAKLYCFSNCYECTGVIYNSVPNAVLLKKEYLAKIKPASIRLDFTNESTGDIVEIIRRLESSLYSDCVLELCDDYTRGHMNKGVE